MVEDICCQIKRWLSRIVRREKLSLFDDGGPSGAQPTSEDSVWINGAPVLFRHRRLCRCIRITRAQMDSNVQSIVFFASA